MKQDYEESIEKQGEDKYYLVVKETTDLGDGKPAVNQWSKEASTEDLVVGLRNTEKTLLKLEKGLTKTKMQLQEVLEPYDGEVPKVTPKMRQIARILEKLQAVNKAQQLQNQIEDQEQKISHKHKMVQSRKEKLSELDIEYSE